MANHERIVGRTPRYGKRDNGSATQGSQVGLHHVKDYAEQTGGKKAVSEHKHANTSIYEPLVSQHKARLSAFRLLLDQSFEGAMGPLMHFLMQEEKLNTKQKKELIEILRNESEKTGEIQ